MGRMTMVQWQGTENSWREVCDLMATAEDVVFRLKDDRLALHTLDRTQTADIGDWIVRDGDDITVQTHG